MTETGQEHNIEIETKMEKVTIFEIALEEDVRQLKSTTAEENRRVLG